MEKTDFLKKRIEEFTRLYQKIKGNVNVSPEMIKKFYDNGMDDLYQGELESKQSDEVIKISETKLNDTILSFQKSDLFKKLNEDCANVLNHYRNEMLTKKRKSCFFQENIIQEVLRTNNLFCQRIASFSVTILKTYKKDPYASLILLRSNIENLFLYHYYVRELDNLFIKEKWLEIARLNARILYSKKKENETRFEILKDMDYLEIVNALVTMHGSKEKPIHVSDCIDHFFKFQNKNDHIKLNKVFETPLLKQYLFNNRNITFMVDLNYHKSFYDQLCEVVHPVAIYRKSYPFDKDDPNVKIKFAASYALLPYVSTLYVYGINIYEKLRSLEFKKINIIEKQLFKSIDEIMDTKSLDFIDENLNNNFLSTDQKKFLEKSRENLLKKSNFDANKKNKD